MQGASLAGRIGGRVHYAWVVAAVAFLVLLAAAGVRSTPGVLIVPLEQAFGWSRATISAAIAVNIFLYGFMGPFAAAAMQRFGIRRLTLCALALLATSVAATTLISQPWQLVLTWGVLVGIGCGTTALVLAATIVNRWFVTRRGLVMGLLTASTATGQLVFLPALAAIAEAGGWRPVAWTVAAVAAVMLVPVYFLLPENPADVGVQPLGQAPGTAPPTAILGNPILRAFRVLAQASRRRDFWLLSGSFFVCGLSTNGLIGTHLISACIDHGLAAVSGAGLLAVMGIFDLLGTTGSGWLSDRCDNRWLLFAYYGLRGLSLIFLPFSDFSLTSLSVFAVFYGLDWIATVPPTLRLTTNIFGREDAAVVFGWIASAHQVGAATATLGAGILRTETDSYLSSFLVAGMMCVLTAVMVLTIGRGRQPDVSLPAAAAAAA